MVKKPDTESSGGKRRRFLKAACQLGTEKDEAALKAKLAQIARQKLKSSARASEKVGWYVRVTTDQVYDGVYNTLMYIAGFHSSAEAENAVRKVRSAPSESYEVLPDPVTADRGPQPERGEVRLLPGAV